MIWTPLVYLFGWILQPKYLLILLASYEYYITKRRSDRLKSTYLLAAERAKQLSKKLMMVSDVEMITDTLDVDIEFATTEHLTSRDSLDDYVVFQAFTFENISDDLFKSVEIALRTKSPKEVFFVQREPYSILTWFINHNAKSKTIAIPERVFLFSPPHYNFVYAVKNPVKILKNRIERYLSTK